MSKIAIIGSGIGGLMCGNLLARKGHKVLMFESHSTPGGYTAGFWRKGFYFESGTYSFEGSDIISKAMRDIGVSGKVEFVRQRIRWLSSRFDFVPESYNDIKENIMQAYPEEKEKLGALFSELSKMVRGFKDLVRPADMFGMLAYPFKMARSMNMFRKYWNIPLSDFAAHYFERDSELFLMFKHMGYPEMSALILAASFWTLLGDYWTVKNGMQSWADVLAENFKNAGGELRLNHLVDSILTDNGYAVGVKSKGEIFKTDYVVSASDYKKTFLKLLDDRSLLNQDFIERMDEAKVSESFFTVYLGLDMTAEDLRQHMKSFHVFYYDKHPEYDIKNSSDIDFFKKVSPSLYSPSLMNSTLAPASNSSLMLQCMCPHRWMDNWGGGDRKKYERLKQKTTEVIIKKTTEIIPNLDKHIIFRDAATPLTYERYTHNTDGASSAWSWNPRNKYYKNPMGAHVATPIKHLLLSSCWTGQIGGIPTAINAAYKCAKLIK